MSDIGEIVKIYNRTVRVDLMYPRCDDRPNAVELDLCDVRASDGLRIVYDFGRDGWVIMQPTKIALDEGEDPDDFWGEVAFVKSFANNLDKAEQKRVSIEPDGVNIIEVDTCLVNDIGQAFGQSVDGVFHGFTKAPAGRYRVLLERIGD